jgi:beta-lactamase class A
LGIIVAAGLVTGCVPQDDPARPAPPPQGVRPIMPMPAPPTQAPRPAAAPDLPPPAAYDAPEIVPPAVRTARAILDARLLELGRSFGGRVGLAVRDIQTGWTSAFNGTALMPQQSVSKFWVALTALDKVDRGELDLARTVVIRRDDMTLFHQPIAARIKGDGYATTLGDLMFRALTESDNTANDFLLRSAGGPQAVREFLRRRHIEGVRFGPGERLLQSGTAGLTWRQEYSVGRGFEVARNKLPMQVRQAALERYLADPVDGASALGLVEGLAKLKQGELLSAQSTQRLLSTMSNTRTGPQRLKGGLEPGWSLAHKTGTGQNLAGTTAGYNDIGIVTSPDGRAYAVAVMIGRTTRGIPERQKLMNEVTRAVIDYQNNLRGDF